MNSEDNLVLAALQIEPSSSLTDTFLQIQELTEQAKAKESHIDCLVLPEYAFGTFREWSTSKLDNPQMIELVHKTISDLARKHKLSIVAGSVPYRTREDQWRNRSYLFSASGSMLGSFDKHHPFRAEKRLGLEPGTQIPVFRVGKYELAILICSDLWYHDLLTPVVDKVDFLAVPTMTTVLKREHIAYGQWVWQALVAVRAKEYTIPIVSADQGVREYAPGVFTCGGSCIADPSHRFSDQEGPYQKALRVTLHRTAPFIISKISLSAIHEYAQYRRDTGLHEEKRE
ncbi:MAG: carbon-nitrogen hydrolase family protein [Candidatus Hodarchaeota archaeon]